LLCKPPSLFFLLLCWVSVHCRIYESSYNVSNISYLNSPPPLFSFIPSSPQAALKFAILLPLCLLSAEITRGHQHALLLFSWIGKTLSFSGHFHSLSFVRTSWTFIRTLFMSLCAHSNMHVNSVLVMIDCFFPSIQIIASLHP
jgi:hypothetical protein